VESFLIGTCGIAPSEALWMTPREMSAAAHGWGLAERTRLVTVARAFGADLSEEDAQRIIEGAPASSGSALEQQEKLQKLADKHGWDL